MTVKVAPAAVEAETLTAHMNSTIQVTGDPPPHIEVTKISKRFGSLQALSEVSLSLRPGTFRALLGENGAGKSTLVKCIMGAIAPTPARYTSARAPSS